MDEIETAEKQERNRAARCSSRRSKDKLEATQKWLDRKKQVPLEADRTAEVYRPKHGETS